MSDPFILITTHQVSDGRLADLDELGQVFTESIEANESDALGYHLYLNEEATELTHVLVQRNADAMDEHFRTSGELIRKALELAETTGIHALGTPGPILRQVLSRNAEAGVPVTVQPRRMAGFTRAVA